MIQELETLHRQGRADLVRDRLFKINFKKVPRSHLVSFANLSRRVGMPNLAIRILNPIVRSEKLQIKPTPLECSEYGVALNNIGARLEAIELLQAVDPEESPQALLYQSFCFFSLWQYDRSIPLLQKYIRSQKISDYEMLIGQVNLAAAFVFENLFEEADQLLNDIKDKCERGQYSVLYGNSLELLALNAYNGENFDLAKILLNEAGTHLKQTRKAESLYVKKWLAIIDCLERPKSKKAIGHLDQIKSQASEESQWEIVRDIDLHKSIINKDRRLFSYVYFGTPQEAYRKNAEKKLWSDWRPSNTYILAPENRNPERVLDLNTGIENNGDRILKPAMINHRLLSVLVADFYRPKNVGAIFSELFPGEYYNPFSSLDRVHQVISRLKKWVNEHSVPMEVVENNGFYSLKVLDGFGCKLTIEKKAESKEHVQILRLKQQMNERSFTSKEASEALNVSRATFSRIVSWGQDKGVIKKEGVGKGIRYRLVG